MNNKLGRVQQQIIDMVKIKPIMFPDVEKLYGENKKKAEGELMKLLYRGLLVKVVTGHTWFHKYDAG